MLQVLKLNQTWFVVQAGMRLAGYWLLFRGFVCKGFFWFEGFQYLYGLELECLLEIYVFECTGFLGRLRLVCLFASLWDLWLCF